MRRIVVASLLLLLGCSWAVGDEPVVLDKNRQLRQAVRTIARYPKEVREAIPVVAQHPDLPGRLLDAMNENTPAAMNEALSRYPKDVQEAAKKLTTYREVLEIMMSQKALTELIGQSYATHGPEKFREIVNEFKEEPAQTEAAVSAWSRRLKANGMALQQLLAATDGFMRVGANQEGFQDYGFGCALTSRNQAVVYGLPSAPLTVFTMVNADGFPEIADEMVEQWLRVRSGDEFDVVMDSWWNMVRQYFRPGILDPDGRPERLAAIARLAKLFGEQLGERPIEAKPEVRAKFIKENIDKFPQLAAVALSEPLQLKLPLKDEPPPKPQVPAKPPQASAKPPTPPKSPGDVPAPQEVTVAKPTQEQQVRQAANNQYFYWYQNPTLPTYSGYPSYYAPYYPNAYFNAYNARRAAWSNGAIGNRGVMNRPIGGGRVGGRR